MEKIYFILILIAAIQIVSNLIFKKFILDYLEDFKKIMTEEVEEPEATKILGFRDKENKNGKE